MCNPAFLAALGMGGGAAAAGTAAATAAGATAAAATAGGSMLTLGTVLSAGGALLQGFMGMQAGKAQAEALQSQAETEAQLTAVEDARTRLQFRSAMREQSAELAARGVTLDSPTAVMLGQSAAQEMAFASQAVRTKGRATQIELSAARRIALGRATSDMFSGVFGAAGRVLRAAPDLWPELNQ